MKYEIFLRFFNDIFCGIKNIFEGTYSYNDKNEGKDELMK